MRIHRVSTSYLKAQTPPDKGPRERWQHSTQQIKVVEEGRSIVAYALEDCVVDFLFVHKLITGAEREAALRFRGDFMAAGMAPKCTAGYSSMVRISSGYTKQHERSEAEEQAYIRWRNAMRAMSGAVSGDVETAACYDKMPAPEKVAFVRVGLKKLIKFYGVSAALDNNINQAATRQVAVRSRSSV